MALTMLLLCLGATIRISQLSRCHAQCDYDHVTARADCSFRNLDCIPAHYPDAVVMDLSHNNISVLEPDDFNGTFTRLAELYLDYNNISNVTSLMRSSNMGSLAKLSVRHNVISHLNYGCELSSLIYFSVDNNMLTSLHLWPRCPTLRYFSANFNLIPRVSSRYWRFSSLLSLQFNRITYFNVYSRKHSISISNVTLLLDHNELEVASISFYGRLKLSISHNRIQDLYTGTIPIELNVDSNGLRGWNIGRFRSGHYREPMSKLDISNNSFDSLIQPDWADGLQILYADENLLSNLSSTTLQGFINLTELHVANNQLLFISSTALSQLTMLRSLYLDGNALTSLLVGVFLNQAELVELSITNNQLSVLHPGYFIGLTSLERLYLAGNRLLYVRSETFAKIPNLITMDLSQNELEVFDLEDCHFLTSLQNLSLTHNSIHDIRGILGHCGNIVKLDIRFNQIQVVPGDSLAGKNSALSRLELEGNPLQCDCRLTDLRDWLLNNPPSALPRCQGPGGHAGAVVTDLDVHDLSCEPPKAITNMNKLQVVVGQAVSLSCIATGIPVPTTTWLDTNGTVILDKWQGRFFMSQDKALHIISVQKADQGTYTCLVQNALGEMDRAVVDLTVTEDLLMKSVSLATSVLPTTFVTLVVTLAVVALVSFLRRRYMTRHQTSSAVPGASELTVGFQKEKASHSDGGYITGIDDGEYMTPTQKQGKDDECEDTSGDLYEDITEMTSPPQLIPGNDDEVYESLSVG